MSYYYNYYLGYKKDNKVYPLGPYDDKGKLMCVFYRSSSFASDLKNEFSYIKEELVSDELRKEFEYEFDGEKRFDLKALEYNKLPFGDFMKKGYCLEKSVLDYLALEEKDEYYDLDEIRYDMLSEAEFAMKAKHELSHGVPKPEKDEFGEEIPVYSCKDYVYFSFMDITTKEYEAFLIGNAASMFEYSKDVEYDLSNVVILLSEG